MVDMTVINVVDDDDDDDDDGGDIFTNPCFLTPSLSRKVLLSDT